MKSYENVQKWNDNFESEDLVVMKFVALLTLLKLSLIKARTAAPTVVRLQ